MNKRNSSTNCCGTCEHWTGERSIIEKEDFLRNDIKVFVECSRNGRCNLKNDIKSNDKKCVSYLKWNRI